MIPVLTIAGSDASGGAGIEADIKTFCAHGLYGMSVITSVVAENTFRVINAYDISAQAVGDQIEAVFEDIVPKAVKIGNKMCKSFIKCNRIEFIYIISKLFTFFNICIILPNQHMK